MQGAPTASWGLGEDVAVGLLAFNDRQQASAIVGQARLGTG